MQAARTELTKVKLEAEGRLQEAARQPTLPIIFIILFFNSGDRVEENWNDEELDVCRKCNIEVVGLDQPKISSSSSILSVI